MKEATGEMNMTVITIIAIGAIIAFFWAMWPTIRNTISNTWTGVAGNGTKVCPAGQQWDGKACKKV